MKRIVLKTLPAALGLVMACGAVHADPYNDVEGFHGYLRAGAGVSSTHGPQSCFGLGDVTSKYRLGNECDSYTEFGYTHELAKSANGVSWVGTIWADAYSPNSNFGGSKLEVAKAYVEARGLPFLNGGTAWIGKRYYYRPDIHMLDMPYINLNGTGGGFDKIGGFGPGKFNYAIFKDNDDTQFTAGRLTNTTSAIRQNFLYEGLPVNAGGTMDANLTIITAQGRDKVAVGGTDQSHNGWSLSAFHKQEVMGGGNTFGVQYGVGPGADIGVGSQGGSRVGGSASTQYGSDVKLFRVFDDIVVQPTKEFSTEFVALYQKDKANDPALRNTWLTAGVRPVYAFSENFKLQGELGWTSLKQDSTGDTARLTKLTIAPTIAMGPSYWSRPELRFYVTYGKWNGAATPLVNANNNSGAVYGNNTSGTSAGLQLEAWW